MKLLQILDKQLVQKTDNTVKLTIGKETKAYPVYKVHLDLLYFNEYNDRIATWINGYESDPNNPPFEGMDEIKRNKIIEKFILETDPAKMRKTKNNIALVSQKVPGVVLNDGRVIDGNRRFTCLRKLREENPDSNEYNYFETAILDLDIKDDRKIIKILELNLQHATDEKADYDLIDFVVGTYRTIEVDKTLTLPEYVENSGEPASKVLERIKLAKLINEYLEFIKLPGQYGYLREKQAYSFFQELLTPLNKCKTEEEQEKLKKMVFTNYMVGSAVDVRKYLRDINTLIGSDSYVLLTGEQKPVIEKVIALKNKADIKDKESLENFTKKLSHEKDALSDITDSILKDFKISKVKKTPASVVNKCTVNLRDIDTRLFSSMNSKEREDLALELKMLKKSLDRICKELDSAEEKK